MKRILAISLLAALSAPLFADQGEDHVVEYLERYHQLSSRDVDGRLRLADWCEENQMLSQEADLLAEVVKLDPTQDQAYQKLLEADAKRVRPVDPQWAARLEGLLGDSFHLLHTPHFTLLTDVDTAAAQATGHALEDAYTVFYRETVKLGMRPMPPAGRLVCVLFNDYAQFRDFERRYELADTDWSSGAYSWRTNRTAFFYERENPQLAEARNQIAQAEARLKSLRDNMEQLGDSETAARLRVQSQIKQESARVLRMHEAFNAAVRMAMAAKTRHEATHQLLFNSGLQNRGRAYPFWFSEGLATVFEMCDPQGHAGPDYINRYRLITYREAERARRLAPLEALLTHQPADNDHTEEVVQWYAQEWALMHFLWQRKPASLVDFWKDLQDHGTPKDFQALFTKHFGEDLKALDQEFHEYVDGLSIPQRVAQP